MDQTDQDEIDRSPTHQYGFPALIEELQSQGVSESRVLNHASLLGQTGRWKQRDRLALFSAARELSRKPETALLAGARQKVSNYGVYGYALASSSTMLDVFRVFGDFVSLSGAVFRISWKVEDGVGVLWSHEPEALGPTLPFITEFWRTSQTKLLSAVLGRPFPSLRMYFPYPAPEYSELYPEFLNCPAHFGTDKLEWHFDASLLKENCINADADTAELYRTYCDQFIRQSGGTNSFHQEILRQSLPHLATKVDATTIASNMNLSLRTFYRRLEKDDITFQSLVDRLRRSIATEYLLNTELSVEKIAERCGYDDVSNFRKAFKRWTGQAPSTLRKTGRDGAGTSTISRS